MELGRLLAIDLNLLVALQALVEERSVSAAARRLGRSQPAMSASLARLRVLFDDELLVREGRGMQLTPRARGLAHEVAEALVGIERALAPRAAFDPASSDREFAIALADFASEWLLEPLLARLARAAPRVRLRVRSGYATDAESSGRLDAWVLSAERRRPDEPHRVVAEDGWVVAGAAGRHRARRGRFAWSGADELRFVIGDEGREGAAGVSNPESREFRRRVQVGLVADRWDLSLVAEGPFVRAVPETLVRRHPGLVSLGRLAGAPAHRLILQWPLAREGDAGVTWLKDEIVAAARSGARRRGVGARR